MNGNEKENKLERKIEKTKGSASEAIGSREVYIRMEGLKKELKEKSERIKELDGTVKLIQHNLEIAQEESEKIKTEAKRDVKRVETMIYIVLIAFLIAVLLIFFDYGEARVSLLYQIKDEYIQDCNILEEKALRQQIQITNLETKIEKVIGLLKNQVNSQLPISEDK